MKLLIIGSGAREHSLAWKLSQECQVFCAPGNPGMEAHGEVFPEVSAKDAEGILSLALEISPDAVIVGPEDPLIAGLADHLVANGYPVFGPGKVGAQLEGSKAFSKAVMARAGVPTAAFEVFVNPDEAKEFARARFGAGRQLAVKASGAALGKGVIVCDALEEAIEAIDRLMVHLEAGEAGQTLVLEDRLVGREFSLLTLVSGGSYLSLPPAQDHKRAYDGDQGPNTGGMGAFSPVDWVSDDLVRQTEEEVVKPVLDLLAKENIVFRGCLFSGLMATEEGPMCLEYNVRLGDPECQAIMRRVGKGLGEALRACAEGRDIPPVEILPEASVALTLAAEGYPASPRKGDVITLGTLPPGVEVFHAGTKRTEDGRLVTSGGRVLSLTATGASRDEARSLAYSAVSAIECQGLWLRSDIGA